MKHQKILPAASAAFPGQYGRAFYSSGAAHSKSPHINSKCASSAKARSMQTGSSAASAAAAHWLISVSFCMSAFFFNPTDNK